MRFSHSWPLKLTSAVEYIFSTQSGTKTHCQTAHVNASLPVDKENCHEDVEKVWEEVRPSQHDPLRQVGDRHAQREAGSVDLVSML